MALVALETPESEIALMTRVALLRAHGIPVFVRGGGFGSLYPGPQVATYNAKTIMVPSEAVIEARDLLDATPIEAHVSEDTALEPRPTLGMLRMVAEFLLFGWCVPPAAPFKPDQHSDGVPNKSLERGRDR